jgi:hypothetical protein
MRGPQGRGNWGRCQEEAIERGVDMLTPRLDSD